jgi:hypothetical protein
MNQIRLISPITDADAARMVRPATLADLAVQITATPVQTASGSPEPASPSPAAPGSRSSARPRGSRRTWRLVLAGGAGLALAAGALAAQAIGSSGSRLGTAITVHELAYRTAAAAAAQPTAAPGQWVYRQEKSVGGTGGGIFQVWTTADSRKAAYLDNGQVKSLTDWCRGVPATSRCGQFIGQPVIQPGGWFVLVSAKMPLAYADLGALPSSPLALDRYLRQLHLPGWGSATDREFEVIQGLLATYVMPPGLTAELYRALGDIPGVTVDQHAVDVAGRSGIGFRLPERPRRGEWEIVINPRTYQPMGQTLIASQPAGSAGRVLSGTAILRQALVSGPGVRP